MKNFEKIHFNGEFRDYQQDVLNNIVKHISDRKVHIVAAPGSGKTILGLELIRMMNQPALILSPSITIRQQWGERFKERFLEENEDIDDYFSTSLLSLSLINSITYQGLYYAINQMMESIQSDDEDTLETSDNLYDYSNFNLIEEIKKAGIKTICLDEAHHLRSEWQKALEKLINMLGEDIFVISLTATPPYDSTPGEWKRYINICGEIDDEIYIPQLVGQKNLCPHQDFIYFNFPNEKESKLLKDNRFKVLSAIDYICNQDYFYRIIEEINRIYVVDENSILENFKEISCILSLASFYNISVNKNLIELITNNNELPKLDLDVAKIGLQFIVSSSSFFFEDSIKVYDELKKRKLTDKKRVDFSFSDKLSYSLVSSSEKLNSIIDIAKHEYNSLKSDLRMVILTDYIKKESLSSVSTSDGLHKSLNTVSIFDALRKEINVSIAILSGSLIVTNLDLKEKIEEIAKEKHMVVTFKNLKGIDNYCEVNFSSKNKEKVAVLTELFEQGFINIIVGTKALLGEGWDSPCINSLILASFVGSFMLSNQMRGRAIRINKESNKCSNIFHLVTLEPNLEFDDCNLQRLYEKMFDPLNKITSSDYENVSKRFDCFLAPAYSCDVIEDGIERIDIIQPPFSRKGIDYINNKMFKIAENREETRKKWQRSLLNLEKLKIVEECEINEFVNPSTDITLNIVSIIILITLMFIYTLLFVKHNWLNGLGILFYTVLDVFTLIAMFKMIVIIIKFHDSKATINTLSKLLLNALKKADIIKSKEAKVETKAFDNQKRITCAIINGTIYEKNIFTKSLEEFLSEIDNPRYLLVKKYGKFYNFFSSFNCPSILANNKENAKILSKELGRHGGKYDLIYTRVPNGKKSILKARKYSYMNKNTNQIKHIKRVQVVNEGK